MSDNMYNTYRQRNNSTGVRKHIQKGKYISYQAYISINNKLKHFHIEDYSGTNFTDNLNDGEEFLYTTIRCKDDKEVTLLCKYVKNKHIKNCPDCVFNKYLCYGLLCNIVVLKVIKDEEK